MGSGMNVEQAKELASKRSYSWAVENITTGKGIKYRKATMIKLRELAEIADRLDRKTENCSEKPNNCETCRYNDYPWYTALCDECKHWWKSEDVCLLDDCNYEPKTEPQTVLNDYSKADDCMECGKFFDCDAPDEVKHASRVTDCAWKKGEE